MTHFLKKSNWLAIASICIATSTNLSSVANAQGQKNLVENGDFRSGDANWKIENARVKDGVLYLNNDGRKDPKAHYQLKNLDPRREYILTADYRPGRAVNLHARLNQPFFKISVDNDSREYLLLSYDHVWNQLYWKFRPKKTSATLTFEGEIKGKDADVDIDNVRVVPVEPKTYRLNAYEIIGAPGNKTKYHIVPGRSGTQALTKDTSSGASPASFELVEAGDGSVAFRLRDNKLEGGQFLTATADGNKVMFVDAKDNNIPDGALFKIQRPGLYRTAGAQSVSFESVKFPKKVLRHFQFSLVVNSSAEARNTPERYQPALSASF